MSGLWNLWRRKPKPKGARRYYIVEDSFPEADSSREIELKPMGEPPSSLITAKAHFEDLFNQTMQEFIAKHVLTHNSPNQRHFKKIVETFTSRSLTPKEKLIGITAELQKAYEYRFGKIKKTLGLGRESLTQQSYDRLYQKLYLNFSKVFDDGEELVSKVKRVLGRQADQTFDIENLWSIPEGVHGEGSSEGALESKALQPEGIGSTPALSGAGGEGALGSSSESEEGALSDIALPNLKTAQTLLFTLVAQYFLEAGNIQSNTFCLIRNLLRPEIQKAGTNELSPEAIKNVQVYLYSALNYEIGDFRSNHTTAFYEALQSRLFVHAFKQNEVKRVHRSYRKALLERRQEQEARLRASMYYHHSMI